ncbi:Importin beta domain containing protein [Balamuthia mandrillaris]
MEGEQVLVRCLSSLLSPEQHLRKEAEEALDQLATQQGCGVALGRAMLNANLPEAVRQMAGVVLKRYVKTHWNEQDHHFVAPVVCPEDKASLRQLLPPGLSDPNSKIRTVVAMALASIAQWDWPEEWPRFIEDLIRCIDDQNKDLSSGALRCLEMFATSENLSDQHLPVLLPLLLPALLQLLSGTYSERFKMRAATILFSCLRWLAVVKGAHPEAADVFKGYLPKWVEQFLPILAKEDRADADCGLKIAVVQNLVLLVNKFPKEIATFLPALIPPIWTSLVKGREIYDRCFVTGEEETVTAQDSDGDILGFESLVLILLELVHSLLEKSAFRKALSSVVPELLYLAMQYLQITTELEDQWESDPNEYIADEDDEQRLYNARASCIQLIQEVLQGFRAEGAKGMSGAAARRLQEAHQKKVEGDPNWWKIREAVVYAIGSVAGHLAEHSSVFDMGTFIRAILLEDIKMDANPFLRGRALWCASQLTQVTSSEQALAFVEGAVATLQKQDEGLPVKICACRALAAYCPRLGSDLTAQVIPACINGLVALLSESSEETLHLVLETVLFIIKTNAEACAPHGEFLCDSLMNIWSSHNNDPLITQDVKDNFFFLAKVPRCHAIMQARLLPVLLQILKSDNSSDEAKLSGVKQAALDMLCVIINGCDDSSIGTLLDHAFPVVISLMLTTDDNSLMNSGTTCCTAFVRTAPEKLVQWSQGELTGLNGIVRVIARLLHPSVEDIAAIYVGPLVTKLINKLSSHIEGSVMRDILQAVVGRMQTAKLTGLFQALLLVFARLINSTDVKSVLELLLQLQVQLLSDASSSASTTQPALHYVLRQWVQHQEDFHGSLNIKASVVALSKLLQLNDEQLLSLPVPGELIQTTTERQTRAKTKNSGANIAQRQEVPLGCRLLELLVTELQIFSEVEAIQEEEDEDAEDSDGGDDFGEDLNAILGLPPGGAGGDDQFHRAYGTFLDELLDDALDEEEMEDPDAPNDPLFELDLKEYLTKYLVEFASQQPAIMNALAQKIQPLQANFLRALLTKHNVIPK